MHAARAPLAFICRAASSALRLRFSLPEESSRRSKATTPRLTILKSLSGFAQRSFHRHGSTTRLYRRHSAAIAGQRYREHGLLRGLGSL